VAVETALVSVILCTLLFGIIECSLLMKDWLAVSASARAGARMAVSEPRLAGFAQDAANQVTSSVSDLTMSASDRLWVYKADTHGMPASGTFASCANPCVQFRWDPATQAFVNLAGSYDPLSQNACAGSASNDSIGVYLKVTHHPLTGWLFGNLTVAESTVMRLEPMSSTGACKP
jgi:Flp pilus assembly protein TadG